MVEQTVKPNQDKQSENLLQQNQGRTNGIFRRMGSSHFPQEFMTPGSTVFLQLARTRLTDENEINDMARLYSWADRHGVTQCKRDLLFKLIGKTAVGGYNLALASMNNTGIISPEAMGVPISKAGMEHLKKENDKKEMERKRYEIDQHAP
jgi:hypothetical protein